MPTGTGTTAPPLDPRDRDTLIAQTAALAQRYSGWRPQPDAAQALIAVFGRFAELVVERINRAPDRGYLAFLNLIGTQPLAPLPARVPLTFTPAVGSPADAVVPAGTQVAAPAGDGVQEAVFETDTGLVVSRARLTGVFVADTESDRWSDRTGTTEPFPVFLGDRPAEHQLFLAADPLLTGDGPANVTFRLTTTLPDLWNGVTWAYLDGTGWRPVTPRTAVSDGVCAVTFTGLPPLSPSDVGGVTAGWLRAQWERPLPPGDPGLPPESVAVGGRAPVDFAPGLTPFGDAAGTKWFYLSADDALAPGGATARFAVTLGRAGQAGPAAPVQLVWTYKVGSEWRELGRTSSAADATGAGFRDGTRALTRNGEISFVTPTEWPTEVFRGREGRWLRVEVAEAGGAYRTLPRIDAMTVGYEWLLPAVGAVTVTQDVAGPVLTPATAFAGSTAVDLSRDFLPFGDQPRFNDTFYLTCPDAVAGAGGPVTLTVTLTNPTGSTTSPVPAVRSTPEIRWETFDGTAWRAAAVTRTDVFSSGGDVRITPAAPLATGAVAGQDALWIRARIVRGDYGQPATYAKNTTGGYDLVPATLAPPMVASLRWRPPPPAAVPPSACVTYNGFVHTTVRTTDPFVPFTPGAEREPALHLCFDRPFGPIPVSLYLPVEPPAPEDVAADRLAELDPATFARVSWEYAGPDGWTALAAVDSTGTLAERGLVQFVGPDDQAARTYFGVTGYWLRARWESGYFAVVPRLRGILPNTIWATQATTVREETLGSGNGSAGQVLTTAQTPVLPGQRLDVREDETWRTWETVPDLHRSGPDDRHYTADPLTGEIAFGDGRAGRLPPVGPNNIRIGYRTGGGAAGNRDGGTVTELKSALLYVDGVTNHEAAQGGAPQESPERLGDRGPQILRHRDRAVTAQDLEDLAYGASADVARARAVPTSAFEPYDLWLDPAAPVPSAAHTAAAAGRSGVIVVPASRDTRPTPTLGLLRQVQAHLVARCPAGAGIWTAGPEWIRVTVTATAVIADATQVDAVRDGIRSALDGYLHPLTGGPAGQGWAFGRKPHVSDLYAVAERVPGVDHLRTLTVAHAPESDALAARLTAALDRSLATSAREPTAPDLQRWLDRALVYAGDHRITMTVGV